MAINLQENILYMDDSIIIINKPAGIAVHGGRGGEKNLGQYFEQLKFENSEPPVLAHRLDKDTSGCLILARNKRALGSIGKMFMSKRILKTYVAIVQGKKFEKLEGRIEISMRKQSELKNSWWMEAHKDGQVAITDYKVLRQWQDYTHLELSPITGRTHQLRVHCKAVGAPIVGDKIYGDSDTSLPMQLHASQISIPQHNKPFIIVEAPMPAHMVELLGGN